MTLFAVCLLGFFLWVALRFLTADDGRPILGVYPRRTRMFPVKYSLYLVVYYGVVAIRRLRLIGKDQETPNRCDWDRPLELTKDIKAFDGVIFTGANRQGYYFIMGAERCHKNVVNGFFYLLVPRTGLFCSFKAPDIVMFDGKKDEFGAGGMLMSPSKPMKKWKLRYGGYMWLLSDPSKRVRVRFAADWSTTYDCFSCREDSHPIAIARSIATEPWTKEFFESVKGTPYVEYYQMGAAKVESTVERESHNFFVQSCRGHVLGTQRDLLSLHRSAFFHLFLENGTMAIVGIISRRYRISLMEVGYVQKPDGRIYPVEWCDFHLYQHGECGRPPLDHGLQFKAGGTVYTAQLGVLVEHNHYTGWNWEAKVIERFVKCAVNGVYGQGISEFRYRNRTGRPTEINDADPPWFQVYRPHYLYS